MKYDPSLTPAYLAGKVDEYVKFAGRDTITRNASRDPHARWARIPSGTACEFCRMLGSRGFVYHDETKAGGKGNKFHHFCNCQIAVAFDPFIDKYEVVSPNGTIVTVTRGYADEAHVVQPGRDGSVRARDVDIDDLYAEYKDSHRDFNKGSRYRNYSRGGKLAAEKFDAYMKMLSEASTLEELYAADRKIIAEWPTKNGRHDGAQWTEMSRHAKEMEKRLKEGGVGKSATVDGNGEGAVHPVETRVLNPKSQFMESMEEGEFHDLIETKFGCRVTKGFRKLPMEVKQPLMADLESVLGAFPEARAGLISIGVSGELDELEAIRCIPVSPRGQYQLVLNKNLLASEESIASRYAESLAKGNQVANSSWPSLAYHDGFHGVEISLTAARYHGASEDFYPSWDSCEIAEEIVVRSYNRLKQVDAGVGDIESVLEAVSGYSTESYSEAICEAAKDVAVNGDTAKLISKLIVEDVRSQ